MGIGGVPEWETERRPDVVPDPSEPEPADSGPRDLTRHDEDMLRAHRVFASFVIVIASVGIALVAAVVGNLLLMIGFLGLAFIYGVYGVALRNHWYRMRWWI